MAEKRTTLVTLATYNEIENLPSLVDEIFAAAAVDILVIDDNSPDGTGRWCEQRAASDPRVRCLHRSGKLGLGTATMAGMKYAIEHGYRYVLNMDADFSHHPRHLPALLAGMERPDGTAAADVMIGSRYTSGGAIEGWPWKRHVMSRSVNAAARCLLGLRVRDCSGSFRCYRTSLLAKVDFDAVRSRGYSFQEEILWHLKRLGAKMTETPITFADRRRGTSKINSQEAFAALGILLRLGARNWLVPKRMKAEGRRQKDEEAAARTTE
ncbi:MAG: polyprenol monophosphomannose synthase [Pirellulales bacterium]